MMSVANSVEIGHSIKKFCLIIIADSSNNCIMTTVFDIQSLRLLIKVQIVASEMHHFLVSHSLHLFLFGGSSINIYFFTSMCIPNGCNGQRFTQFPIICPLLVVMNLCSLIPWVWAGPSNSLLMNRIWPKWWDVTSEMGYKKTVASILDFPSDGSQLSCGEYSVERPRWQKAKGSLQLITNK